MNWITENKFLAGFAGFMIVALGALGFMVFKASGDYNDQHTQYMQQVGTLNTLQNRAPYPNQDNLAKYAGQKTDLNKVIDKLEADVARQQFPLEPDLKPEQFQDKLRSAANAVVAKAKAANIKVPDKIGLGFEKYLTEPPKPGAAPVLARELAAIDFLVNQMIESHILSITPTAPINRTPLPEESGTTPPKELVRKSPLEISFTCDQSSLRKILTDINQNTKQFFIVRQIAIKNQVDKSLSKKVATDTRKDKTGGLRRELGGETIDVTMKLEIVNFNPPAAK